MSSHVHHTTADPYAGRDKPVRTYASVVGAVVLLVGIAGFIPGVTTDYDTMQFAGHASIAMGHEEPGNFVPTNAADDYLHLGLAIGIVALGLIGRQRWRGSHANRTAM